MKTASSKIKQGPGDPEWEQWSLDRIREALERTNLSTATAFLIRMRDELFHTPGNRLDNEADIIRTAEKMHRDGRLPFNQEITEALDEAWAASRYFRCKAYDDEVLREATDANLYPSRESYLQTIECRGRDFNWTRNLRGEQELKAQRNARHRQRLIAIIANGKSTYPLWMKEHGQVRYLPVDGLTNETDEMLETLAATVPQLREQMAGGRKETKPHAEEGISLTAPAQKTLAVADDELLVNPATGVEYTAAEIKKLSQQDFRRLVFSQGQSRGTARTNAINRILAGRKYGE